MPTTKLRAGPAMRISSDPEKWVPITLKQPPAEIPPVLNENMSIVTITPEMAFEMLERKGVNRPITQNRVKRYAASMLEGWKLTYEAIKLDTQGRVKDGQHRLWACIEAGVSFTTLVVINVEEDAFDVMDSGLARSNADVAALHGVENAGAAAGCARISLLWDNNGFPGNSNNYTPSKPQILNWFEKNPDYPKWVTTGRRISKNGIAGGESIWSTILYRLSRIDELDADVFAASLISGANLETGSPILALRKRMLLSAARREHPYSVDVAAFAVKAWNFWRKGKECQLIVWKRGGSNREAFPVPV